MSRDLGRDVPGSEKLYAKEGYWGRSKGVAESDAIVAQ